MLGIWFQRFSGPGVQVASNKFQPDGMGEACEDFYVKRHIIARAWPTTSFLGTTEPSTRSHPGEKNSATRYMVAMLRDQHRRFFFPHRIEKVRKAISMFALRLRSKGSKVIIGSSQNTYIKSAIHMQCSGQHRRQLQRSLPHRRLGLCRRCRSFMQSLTTLMQEG